MEDRYELRGKIGQGGLGAVYRAYDTRMSRIVAIKRITPGASDTEHVEESTKQLVKEAGALAKLQHPNIVTIHDVGSDSDGPFVVMELIEGKTLDEAIDHAPLTWPDFRELAMQVMEALIAAQEHNLIHSDLKPANLMVTWLPSGKFQIKIVDFGLASLSLSQKKEDLKSIDVVYGSIFFMPPEQFERQPLDLRSDMYSIGCVFYQALAGRYPFNGTTANEVMDAHLNHHVTPLKEVRAGIPVWVSDWVMWHLNRDPKDRPASARDSLSNFLQNDKYQGHPLTTGMPAPVAGPPRARMRRPGEAASHEPPPHETAAHPVSAPEPVPLRPPEGLKPSVHTATVEVVLPSQPDPASQPLSRTSAIPTGRTAASTKGPSHSVVAAKTNKKIIPIAVACVSLIVIGGIVMKLNSAYSGKRLAADLLTQVEANGGSDIPVTQKSLASLLDFLSTNEGAQLAPRLCPALAKVKASDSTDVDLKVAELVAGESSIPLRTRDLLITETLAPRANPSILPAMLKIVETGKDKELVASSLVAVRPMLGDEHFDPMLKVLCDTSDPHAQSSAETNITEILRKAKTPAVLVDKLKSAKGTAVKQDVIQSLKRLITTGEGMAPGERASVSTRPDSAVTQNSAGRTGTGTQILDDTTVVLRGTKMAGHKPQDFPLAFPATGRYLTLETLSSKGGQKIVNLAELVVLAPGNIPVPNQSWKMLWTDSEELHLEKSPASNLIDGNLDTYWHSRYSPYRQADLPVTPHPHYVMIDLGERKTVSAIRLIGRLNNDACDLEKFRIHLSDKEFQQPSLPSTSTPSGTTPEEKVGTWTPSNLSGNINTLNIDLTSKLTSAGAWEVKFQYTSGDAALVVSGVKLLVDGDVKASDPHQGRTGNVNSANTWNLAVPTVPRGSSVTLQAIVSGDGNNNSTGIVTLRKLN